MNGALTATNRTRRRRQVSRRAASSLTVSLAVSLTVSLAVALAVASCADRSPSPEESPATVLPSILLVTLDTTRADRIGYDRLTGGRPHADTPELDRLAASGVVFAHAYTTAPTTLPAHASMLTGRYPSVHGIHQNSRRLGDDQPLIAEVLAELGYHTSAFVSGLPLERQFGLARGFEVYDDAFAGSANERRAVDTTDRVLAHLATREPTAPAFVWVHYYDPHEPYDPPEPFRSRYPADPYLGEIAYLDGQLGRLFAAFAARFSDRPRRIIVAGDHGEGRGDHGEAFHGNLLYQGVMRVPLIIAGTGLEPAVIDRPVSTRRIFDTIADWAGASAQSGVPASLLEDTREIVLGEAMKPFLEYGWQPQVMAIAGGLKVIRAGALEVYDLEADVDEERDLAGRVELVAEVRQALRAYPLPSATTAPAPAVSAETRRRLASLGYADWSGAVVARADAPRPRDMASLFADLDRGSGLFASGDYPAASAVFERVIEHDPENLMVVLRLAVAQSLTDHPEQALALFERARRIQPGSSDVRHYLGMHYLRSGRIDQAEPLLESVLAETPDRLPAVVGMAEIRERQQRLDEACALLERAAGLEAAPAAALAHLGELRMAQGRTELATAAFERALAADPDAFRHQLELGVLYLAAQRLVEARDQLDRVGRDHPGYAMALFKRAQVSVLLAEPDREDRLRAAVRAADATTRALIEREPLFRGLAR